MAKAKNKEIVEAQPLTLAEQYFSVIEQMAFFEEQKKELAAALLENMKRQGVKSVKLNNGTTFTRAERQTLKPKDEEKAWEWAESNYALKIDTSKAMQILRRELKMPSFFKVEKSEYLVVKRA